MAYALTSTPIAFVEPEALTAGAPIVVLAPHPDDESLGCGGLLGHAFAHHGAQVICMTDGSASHPASRDWPALRLAARRHRELISAVACLGGGLGDVTWLGHPDGWLGAHHQDPIVKTVAEICLHRRAMMLFAPAPEDHHEDHKSTARIARAVANAVPGLLAYSYSVWNRWDDSQFLERIIRLNPVALNTSAWSTAKRKAINAHASQLGRIVMDDPDGFTMPPGFVNAFVDQPEIFWKATI